MAKPKESSTKKRTTSASAHSRTSGAHTKSVAGGPRRLNAAKKVWHKPSTWRQQNHSHKPLPKARAILMTAFARLRGARQPVIGITAIYGLGVVLLVRGFSASQDFTTLKVLLDSLLTGATGKLQSIVLQITLLFGGTGSAKTPNGGIYQTILLVICSLAIIWVLRRSQAKQVVSVKDAFYRGMSPLVPFVLVLFMIGLQTLPLVFGSYLYTALIGGGVAVHASEKLAILAIFAALAFWSLRMITSSIFALYIVTLPNMQPLQALRSARQLVHGRRLLVWRKLLLLPVAIIVGTSVAVLPFILFLTPLVVWVFFILSTVWFALIHGYLYTLYREMIDE